MVDIGLRMLQPRELYRAQGFPTPTRSNFGHDGKPFTKSEQVHMCGNSVSPPHMAAIARGQRPLARRSGDSAANSCGVASSHRSGRWQRRLADRCKPFAQEKNDVNDSFQGATVEAAQRRRRLVMNTAQSTRADQP